MQLKVIRKNNDKYINKYVYFNTKLDGRLAQFVFLRLDSNNLDLASVFKEI